MPARTLLVATLFCAVLAPAATSRAQSTTTPAALVAPRLRAAEYRRELASIDQEATGATALYVTGVILVAGAVCLLPIGSIALSRPAGSSGGGSGLLAGAGLGGVLGIMALIAGAVLDSESGARRRRLIYGASLSVAPSPDGVMLAVAGRF